ncbi:universal stress protein [Magnetospira sp. QH-2]|uniref:universal stress protein n=1 Tax=Magnetospira sp. (strain QH-2) TaxID=1288970 RepID=UPI0003E81628|nr:universal stress protein [Magnetospira sp. QH-2]CCQ73848.1 Conserved protein of unknown function, Containing UspA domain [Magnetospira sp. QH-2]
MLELEKIDNSRFRILVCIDGSDESYRGLRYAAKLGGGVDADICLVYVRAVDQGLRSGGLQVSVARENMLDWGLELPGIKYLKTGLEMLAELGVMGDGWSSESFHTDVAGDPLGDNKIVYRNEDGKQIILKLKTAANIATGILEQWEIGQYDLIILGASERWRGGRLASFWDPEVAEHVATKAPCSVLVARELTEGNGHLICTDGSEVSLDAVRQDAILASRCECPISLMSVALEASGEADAEIAVEKAKTILEEMKVNVEETIVKVGDPVDQIVETGPDYSLIVVSESEKSGLQRLIKGSVAYKIMQKAFNSVLVVR